MFEFTRREGKPKKKMIINSELELQICKDSITYEEFCERCELSFELSKRLIAKKAISKIILN